MRDINHGFESRSEPEFFSGLCSGSAMAALALMTIITQLLLMDKINFKNNQIYLIMQNTSNDTKHK